MAPGTSHMTRLSTTSMVRMETVSAGLLFGWLFLLARTTQAYAEAPRRVGTRDA